MSPLTQGLAYRSACDIITKFVGHHSGANREAMFEACAAGDLTSIHSILYGLAPPAK